jgi:outer membrane protein assembly factor BamB
VANGVLYYAGGSTIRALNPADGQQLWSDDSLGGIHWESPVVAGGMLYVTDEAGHLTAWAPSTPLGVSYLPMRLLQ